MYGVRLHESERERRKKEKEKEKEKERRERERRERKRKRKKIWKENNRERKFRAKIQRDLSPLQILLVCPSINKVRGSEVKPFLY